MKTAGKIVISVVVTAGIIIGATAFAHRKAFCDDCTPDERAEHIADFVGYKLDLDDAQSGKLTALVSKLLVIRSEVRQDRDAMRQELIEIMSAPSLDQDRVLTLVREKTSMVDDYAPDVVPVLAEFTNSLNAEQKKEITDLIEWKMSHDHH